MKDSIQQRFDVSATGRRLKRLSTKLQWTGGGLMLIAAAGIGVHRSSAAPLVDSLFVLLTIMGSLGLGLLASGNILWRTVYGSFPNVFSDHGPDAQ
jgi:hypothetical protein